MEEHTSVALNHPVCGHLLQQPRETNTDNMGEQAAPGNVCSKELAESRRVDLSGNPGTRVRREEDGDGGSEEGVNQDRVQAEVRKERTSQ